MSPHAEPKKMPVTIFLFYFTLLETLARLVLKLNLLGIYDNLEIKDLRRLR